MASTDIEKLMVQLSADIKKFENALNRANGHANKRAKAIETRFERMNKRLSAGFAGVSGAAARAFALIGGASGFRTLSDSATRIDNALKVAGLSGAELESVYSRLFQSAQKNAAPLETLVELYGRVSLVQNELGISSDQLVSFSDNIAVAIRASGKSAEEASGALLQLSQALGAGVVRAEEFNSIIEGAPTIAQAAAAGIKEAGGSVATLRKLMLDGKLSSKAFFDGINAGAPMLQEKLASSVLTIDQRLENLKTALVDAARRFNNSGKAAETFGAEIDGVSKFVNDLDFDSLISEFQDISKAVSDSLGVVDRWVSKLREAAGLGNIGKAIVNSLPGDETMKSYFGGALAVYSSDAVADRINSAFEGQISNVSTLTEDAIKKSVLGDGKGGRVPANVPVPASKPIKPVSLSDYKVPASSGGGKSGAARINDYERELQQINERTIALRAETAAQAALNPLVDDYGLSAYRMQAAQDLLTAAQHAGTAAGKELTDVQQLLSGDFSKLTPQARAQAQAMLDMTGKYGLAVQASNRLAEAQDEIRQKAENALNTAKDVTRGLIDDFTSGTSAAETFANALKKIGDTLIDDVLSSVFSLKSATSGNWLSGLFGGLFGGSSQFAAASAGKLLPGLFAEGGYTGNGGKYDPAGIVHRGEYVFDQEAVRAAGGPAALEAMRKRLKGYSGGGYVGAVAPRLPDISAARMASAAPAGGSIHIDVTGARGNAEIQDMVAAGVQKGIAAYDKQMPGRVQQIQQSPRFRG